MGFFLVQTTNNSSSSLLNAGKTVSRILGKYSLKGFLFLVYGIEKYDEFWVSQMLHHTDGLVASAAVRMSCMGE